MILRIYVLKPLFKNIFLKIVFDNYVTTIVHVILFSM